MNAAFICSQVALLLTQQLVFLVLYLPLMKHEAHFDSQLEENFICSLSHKILLIGPVAHAITSTGVDNGTIIGVHSAIQTPSLDTAFHHNISSSVPNSLPSLVRVESVGNQSSVTDSTHSLGPVKFDVHGTPAFHPHSLPEYHDGLTNGSHCNSPGTATATVNPRPPERIDNRQFCRVNSNGHSIDLSEGGKYKFFFNFIVHVCVSVSFSMLMKLYGLFS